MDNVSVSKGKQELVVNVKLGMFIKITFVNNAILHVKHVALQIIINAFLVMLVIIFQMVYV